MARETRKVECRRLLLLIPRLLALALLWRSLTDWSASSMPAYAGLAHDVIGVVSFYLLAVFVMVPGLEACGEKIARSQQKDVTSFRGVCGFALLACLMIGLNRLRYFLEIDADPLYNRLWNVLMGLTAGIVYIIMRYLDRRKSDMK